LCELAEDNLTIDARVARSYEADAPREERRFAYESTQSIRFIRSHQPIHHTRNIATDDEVGFAAFQRIVGLWDW
jgi:hypothetical protein